MHLGDSNLACLVSSQRNKNEIKITYVKERPSMWSSRLYIHASKYTYINYHKNNVYISYEL